MKIANSWGQGVVATIQGNLMQHLQAMVTSQQYAEPYQQYVAEMQLTGATPLAPELWLIAMMKTVPGVDV